MDIDEIKMQFNEAMNAWTNSCEDGSCCPELQKKNSGTGEWESLDKLCGFEYDGTKNFIFTIPGGPGLDPDSWHKAVVPEGYFRYLAGKGNKKFSFKFKTAASSL